MRKLIASRAAALAIVLGLASHASAQVPFTQVHAWNGDDYLAGVFVTYEYQASGLVVLEASFGVNGEFQGQWYGNHVYKMTLSTAEVKGGRVILEGEVPGDDHIRSVKAVLEGDDIFVKVVTSTGVERYRGPAMVQFVP